MAWIRVKEEEKKGRIAYSMALGTRKGMVTRVVRRVWIRDRKRRMDLHDAKINGQTDRDKIWFISTTTRRRRKRMSFRRKGVS